MSDTPETTETTTTDAPLQETADIKPTDASTGESASAASEEAAPSSAPSDAEPSKSADEVGASSEPEAPEAAPGDIANAEAAQAAATGAAPASPADAPAADATPEAAPADDKPAEEPTKDDGSTDSAPAPIEAIPVEAIPASQPIFDGRPHPSPLPDTGDDEVLPGEPETGHGPGDVPGTTEKTQAALPPVGPTTGTPGLPTPAQVMQSDAAAAEAAATPDKGGLPDATDADAPAVPEAAPTAPGLPEVFQVLSDSGKEVFEAVNKVQDDLGHVLALELKGLANFAAALSSRIEDGSLAKEADLGELPEVLGKVIELATELFAGPDGSKSDAPAAGTALYTPPAASEVIDGLGDDATPTLDVLWGEGASEDEEE